MRPIFHLSFPVLDLEKAIAFYQSAFGAAVGRHNEEFADILLWDAQITLHQDQPNVTVPMPRTRHFGVTLGWSDWETAVERLRDHAQIVAGPTVSYLGKPVEQAKLMIADTSGNLIELKAYRHPEDIFGEMGRR